MTEVRKTDQEALMDQRNVALTRSAIQLAMALAGSLSTLDNAYPSGTSIEEMEARLLPEERYRLGQAQIVIGGIRTAIQIEDTLSQLRANGE